MEKNGKKNKAGIISALRQIILADGMGYPLNVPGQNSGPGTYEDRGEESKEREEESKDREEETKKSDKDISRWDLELGFDPREMLVSYSMETRKERYVEALGVSKMTVERALLVVRFCDTDIQNAVDRGLLSLEKGAMKARQAKRAIEDMGNSFHVGEVAVTDIILDCFRTDQPEIVKERTKGDEYISVWFFKRVLHRLKAKGWLTVEEDKQISDALKAAQRIRRKIS